MRADQMSKVSVTRHTADNATDATVAALSLSSNKRLQDIMSRNK